MYPIPWSSGTRRTDRVTKAFEYADAGIPAYWIIDLEDPASLTAYVLVDGDYEIAAQTIAAQTEESVKLSECAPLTIDVQ